jgi:uncharacterized protein with FMN-binding domain
MIMKRILTIAVVLLLAVSLMACSGGKYKAGTYTGEGIHREHGYETADVTVDANKITNIVLHRVNADGTEVNYDEWTGEPVNGKTLPNLKQYRTELAQAMLQQQSTDVNAISGATDSSNGWKQAVQAALDKAKK